MCVLLVLGCGDTGSVQDTADVEVAQSDGAGLTDGTGSPPNTSTDAEANADAVPEGDDDAQGSDGQSVPDEPDVETPGEEILCHVGPDPLPEVTAPSEIHVSALPDGEIGTGTLQDPYRDLQVAIDAAPDGARIRIGAGVYEATPAPYADPGCGNCDDATFAEGATATRGFLIQGKSLHLEGSARESVFLMTNAGYGVLFDEAGTSSIRSLSISGGVRDADGKATDAGIVVRMTDLVVADVAVVANDDLYTGQPDPVVGIGGIFGREGAVLTIRDCIIEDNSWDGITLYRGLPGQPDTAPRATVERCRVGCTSQCVHPRGRGVGIAATWDSQLTAIGNDVHHYWKGMGSFGATQVAFYNNVVRDQVGWGLMASGDGSHTIAVNNVVVRNGTTGLSAWNWGATGVFANNIVAYNGTSDDEWVGKKTGIWFNANPDDFAMHHNLSFDNALFDACTGGYPNADPCILIPFDGVDGNMVVEPGFVSETDWHLTPGSPGIDAGDPDTLDPDCTRSDLGVHGGPRAVYLDPTAP